MQPFRAMNFFAPFLPRRLSAPSTPSYLCLSQGLALRTLSRAFQDLSTHTPEASSSAPPPSAPSLPSAPPAAHSDSVLPALTVILNSEAGVDDVLTAMLSHVLLRSPGIYLLLLCTILPV